MEFFGLVPKLFSSQKNVFIKFDRGYLSSGERDKIFWLLAGEESFPLGQTHSLRSTCHPSTVRSEKQLKQLSR